MGTWRLILAWMVVAGHTKGYDGLFSIDIGTIAVSTFFFISGFLMPLTYETHYRQNGFMEGSGRFYLNRLLRIYPIYWVSLFVELARYWVGDVLYNNERLEHIGLLTYIQNFLLIGLNQSRLWGGYDRFNNPAWTLDVELQYYMLVPLLLFAASRYKILLKLVLITFSAISLYLYFNPIKLVDVDQSILSWFVFFVMGLIFYQAMVWKCLSNSMYLVALVIATLFLAVNNGREIATLLVTISFIIVSAFLLAMQKDYKFGHIDRLAGDLSYPTYILHIVFFLPTDKILGLTHLAKLAMPQQFLLTCFIHILVSTSVGYVALRFISDPIDLFRVRIRGSKD